ncbi:MAG: sulfatase-like hydrolase/transferase [Acidobacteria bacterium]|nr:sulfatase-like hydrolase/transferase [Acidobacteriota bacterium]
MVPMLPRRSFLASALAAAAPSAFTQSSRRPNVLFIFVDDLGFGDFGVTGNRDVPTPNIDRLASQGTLFSQFYVASPICSPSRVGVTTGQFPARHLIHSFLASRQSNADLRMRDWLDPKAPCVARAFQQAGYATGHFGKWHMGGGRDVGDAPLPQAYGFDDSYTSFEGLGDRPLIEGDNLSKQSAALGRGRIDWAPKHKLTEMYVDRTIAFLRRNRAKPFYIHLWPCDVHDAHQPRPDLLEKYKKFSANPYVQRFYAVLDEFDRQLGRLLAELDALGLAENTIVALTGDNGPTAWPRYYKEGFEPPGSQANFRGRKWSLYEGGIRLPFIVRWPGHTPAGKRDDSTILGSVDLFPTFTTLCRVPAPKVAFDGEDMSPALLGKPRQRKRPLFWEYGRTPAYLKPGKEHDQSPNLAIRDGRWKLLINDDGSRRELYDFNAAQNEESNVAAQHPQVAERLARALLAWRRTIPEL